MIGHEMGQKGNNSCKMLNFGIKVKNQKVYYIKHYKKNHLSDKQKNNIETYGSGV